VDVKIIDFGWNNDKAQYEEHNFNEANVAALVKVKSVQWKKHIRWIDIHGDAPEVIQLLANENDVPPFIVDETHLKLSGKVQFFPEHKILEIVTHRVALENLPLRQMTDAEIHKRPKLLSEEEEERDITKKLITGNGYLSPEVRHAQIMFFCFGEHTVLTVRRRSHLPAIANVFSEIPGDIRQFTSEIRSHMEITSTREFLCSLLNEVNEQNWLLKDNFKEWKVILEKDIHHKLGSGQSRHLLDLDRTANAAVKILDPFIKSAVNVFNLEELSEDQEDDGKKSEQDKQDKQDKKDKKDTSEDNAKALQFVLKEKALFRDTTLSAQRLVESLKFTRDTAAQLNEFYRHQSEEQQNNTLKTLTVNFYCDSDAVIYRCVWYEL